MVNLLTYIHSTSHHHTFRWTGENETSIGMDCPFPLFYMVFDNNDNYRGCGTWETGHGCHRYMQNHDNITIWCAVSDRRQILAAVKRFKQTWKRLLNTNANSNA